MAKNSSVNLDITPNADGYSIAGGTTSRSLTLTAGNVTLSAGGSNTYTLPAATGTLVSRDSTDALTNKSLTTPVVDQFGTTSGLGAAWTSTTGTWTGMTVGNATNVLRYKQIGKIVEFEFEFTVGSTTSFSGTLYINFPVTAVTYIQYHRVGLSSVMNAAGGVIYNGSVAWDTTGRMIVLNDVVNVLTVRSQGVSNGTPISLATGAIIIGHGMYEAA